MICAPYRPTLGGTFLPISGPPLLEQADPTHLLARGLRTDPDGPALISAGRTWSWTELERDANALASSLIAMGLKRGDRVASLMPNRGELLLLYLACFRAGFVTTPLNYRYTPPEIDYALQVSGAAALCVGVERRADIEASALAKNLPMGLIAFGGPLPNARAFEDMVKGADANAAFPQRRPDEPAVIFFTSGSTGKPKGVTHSLRSLGSMAAANAQAFGLSADDVVLPASSVAHAGAYTTFGSAFFAGSTLVIPQRFDADEVLKTLRTERPTVMIMLPAAFIAVERDPSAVRDDFSSLRLLLTGGDLFPPSLVEEAFEHSGTMIHEVYGLSEIVSCLFNPSEARSKVDSVGKVAPGVSASLRDDTGQEVPPNTDGTLWLRGDPLMTGYWNNKEATDAVMDDGWFNSGDVMSIDEDNFFYFRGRRKQIIVHDGSNIAPQEIEAAVMAHESVDLAGVIGVHDEVHGENVWAYVTVKQGAEAPKPDDVIAVARAQVGYKAPEVVVVLDEMPLNPTGKIDRPMLKRMAETTVHRNS